MRLCLAPSFWALEKMGVFDEKPAPSATVIPSVEEITKMRDAQFKQAEEAPVINHEVVNANHLKSGDTIIHDGYRFKIAECGRGFGAGNDFGNYFWIKGHQLVSHEPLGTYKEFWSYQACPVIRLK